MYVENFYKMKNYLISLLLAVLFIWPIAKIYAQPLKAPMFGKDIIIHEQPDKDQQDVAICSAFNGWLYSAFAYDSANKAVVKVFKSLDNGESWESIWYYCLGLPNERITKIEILTTGNTLTSFKIILGFSWTNIVSNTGGAVVLRFNGATGIFEENILQDPDWYVKDFALASDFNFPAQNSNPNSIAVVYSKEGWPSDSIIITTSDNGGGSFTSRHSLPLPYNSINKVAITYGYCQGNPKGRYFVAWEQHENLKQPFGHIYTAFTFPDFNSPLSNPICLDALVPSASNLCSNPVISCQTSNFNNDSSDMTLFILCEQYLEEQSIYNILGFYNLQPTSSNYFKDFILTNQTHSSREPSIIYNIYDTTFYATYFDSTEHNLPLVKKNANFFEHEFWQLLTTAYNDDEIVGYPNPKVSVNHQSNMAITTWISEGLDSNGLALFDGQDHVFQGFDNKPDPAESPVLNAYPNPVIDYVTIEFDQLEDGIAKLELRNSMGQLIDVILDKTIAKGNYKISYNMMSLPTGSYFIILKNSHGLSYQCVQTAH